MINSIEIFIIRVGVTIALVVFGAFWLAQHYALEFFNTLMEVEQ